MRFFIGTYSQSIAGTAAGGAGIYRCDLDAASGDLSQPVLVAPCINPSYLALGPSSPILYAVQEVFADAAPAVQSFIITPDGGLTPHSRQPIPGELPCHLAVDPSGHQLATAQYWTGDVALFPLAADGAIGALATHLTHAGTGPNAARQGGSHAHYVAFTDDGSVLHVTDLGTDRIFSYTASPKTGADAQADRVSCPLPPGCGPRHMTLTGDASRAFVFCELDESLISLTRFGLGWEIENVQPGFTAPEGKDGAGAAIRLSPDESHIYVSGRRQSRIACFAIDDAVVPLGEVDCGGESPRDFILSSDGHWVIVANQNSNTLTSLRRDPETGLLAASGQSCAIGSPVALAERFG